MPGEFHSKHVVITGGTGALGTAIVESLLERGAICHVPCFGGSVPEDFHLADHERVHVTAAVDLAVEDQVVSFFASVPALWASVHACGGFAMAPILDTSVAEFQKMLSMNTISCFLTCREAVRAIRANAADAGGRIVNVAARVAVEPAGGMIAYTTSKAAVASITRCLAREVVAESILVNAILPSIIDTPANRAAMPEADFSSWPRPSELAETILFLASPRNSVGSGTLAPVYGRG